MLYSLKLTQTLLSGQYRHATAAAATAPPPRPSKYIDFTTKSQFLEFQQCHRVKHGIFGKFTKKTIL